MCFVFWFGWHVACITIRMNYTKIENIVDRLFTAVTTCDAMQLERQINIFKAASMALGMSEEWETNVIKGALVARPIDN